MVIEQIKIKYIERKPFYIFFFGLFYVVISYFTSTIFFKMNQSIAMIFIITLLLVPTVMKLISLEEKRERSDALLNFIKDHKDIFEIYLFLFLGIFVGFLVFGLFSHSNIFDYQINFLEKQEGLSSELVKDKLQNGINGTFQSFLGIIENNLFVVIVAFILSFFYGAGAMFLIVLNASIFSTFIVFVMNNIDHPFTKLTILGIFFIHMIPELLGFLFAAIAGGVISKALLKEKFGTEQFRNVLTDAAFILIISLITILIAAFLETYVTTFLVNLLI